MVGWRVRAWTVLVGLLAFAGLGFCLGCCNFLATHCSRETHRGRGYRVLGGA